MECGSRRGACKTENFTLPCVELRVQFFTRHPDQARNLRRQENYGDLGESNMREQLTRFVSFNCVWKEVLLPCPFRKTSVTVSIDGESCD